MASIQKRDNGKYRARYRDEAGKEHARHFPRKVDAQAWLNEVTASVVTGTYVDPRAGTATFDAWFADWSTRQVWAPMTQVQGDLVRRSVPFATVPLAQLRQSHLQAWVRQMQVGGYAPNTINTRMMTVRAALKGAVADRRIVLDPSVGVKLPRRQNREKSLEVASSSEVGAIIRTADEAMRAFPAVMAFAGLRPGEAAGLKVEDIDFLRRRVEVQRQVQKRRGGPAEIRAPKYESFRTVFVSDELLAILAQHVERHLVSPDGFLFVGASLQPIPPTSVHSWWSRTVKAAGVTGVTPHSMRHYFASGLIAEGCDVVTVQRALGHKSPSVTLNTYSHLWPTAEDRTRLASGRMAAEALADSLRTEVVL